MLSHVDFGVADLESEADLYGPPMAELGPRLALHEPGATWAAWMGPGAPRPLFMIGLPFDRAAPAPGNGTMVALLAPDRPTVGRCHALALAKDGRDEGAPGLRPHDHAGYYGAYFRDRDGNKLCVCCHDLLPTP